MRRNSSLKVKDYFLMTLLLLQLCAVVFGHVLDFGAEVSAQPSTVVGIDPQLNTAEPGEYFTINLNVTAVEDLYSWGARIGWPIGLLSTGVDNITEGPFLKAGGTTSFTKKVFAGYVDVGSTLLAPATTGVTGSGILATIKFRVLDGGDCTLKLDPARATFFNSTFALIPRTLQDGYFYTDKPVAKFIYSPHPIDFYGHPLVGETVTFNATDSYDPDEPYDLTPGGIVDYQWDFGDDTTGAGVIAAHAYNEPGSYTVTLNVTDDEGKTDTVNSPMIGDPTIKVQLHDIAVINVTVTPPTFSPGGTLAINVTVLNRGSVTEGLNVTVYQNFSPVKVFRTIPSPSLPDYSNMFVHKVGPVWTTSLEPGKNGTTTLLWDTTGVYPGNYSLGVYVFLINPANRESVPDLEQEEVLPDNWMLYGTITATGEERHDLAIEQIKVNPTSLKIGQFSNIEVTLRNRGNVNEQYNATIAIQYGSEMFSQKPWVNQTIKAGETVKLEFNSWLQGANTTREGTYNVTASVVIVNATTLDFLAPYNATVPDDDPTNNKRTELTKIQVVPVARFTYAPSAPIVDAPVVFDASASYAPGVPEATITEFSWDFGDGVKVTQTSSEVTHRYRAVGPFTVILEVTDHALLKDTISKSLVVNATNSVFITNLAFSPSVVTIGSPVDIDVTVNAYINVTAGAPVSLNFDLTAYYGDNEIDTQSDVTLATGGSITLSFTWDTTDVSEGNYAIRAVATTPTGETTFVGGAVSVNRQLSSLTLEASPAAFTVGATTTINGTLSPALGGVDVEILYRMSGEETWTTLATVTTDSDGFYERSWTPEKAGAYSVKSTWEGDNLRMPSESELLSFSVQEPQASGIFLYTTIALAVVVVAMMVFYLVRMRKPKAKPEAEAAAESP